MGIVREINWETDLREALAKRQLQTPLIQADNEAHKVRVAVKDGGEAADLTGCSCIGYFLRADGETVAISGSGLAGIEDSTAWVVLPMSCYAVPGRGGLVIRLIKGDVRSTVLTMECSVYQSTTGQIIDPGHVVPDLDELLAQIERMESATAAAEEAAERAEEAAEGIEEALDGKLGIADYSAAAAVGTADNLIDRRATATEQEWSGMRTSCGDVSISDDGTARIDAVYGNTVDGVSMTVNAIETVGFNLFDKNAFTGGTEQYDGLTCVKISGTEAGTKLIDNGAYLGLGQVEISARIHKGANYHPRMVVTYADGTQERVTYYKANGGDANAWGTFYFLTDADKTVVSISAKHSGSTANYPEYIELASICIHFTWSGYRNGEYEDHWRRTLSLPVATYFPNGMMSVGSVRDELRADRAIQRCELSGGLVVALEEPVITPIDPPLNLVYTVADFGTENAKSVVTSSPFIADIAYNSDFRRMIGNNQSHIGTISELQTDAKTDLVAAINELAARIAALEGGA